MDQRGNRAETLRPISNICLLANFLALFLLIIADFFIQGGLNVYTAILTMILGRLTFSSLAKFVRRMLALGIDDEEDD